MEQCDLFWKQEISHDGYDFTSQIEWVGDFIYLHCKVHKNTPHSIRAVKRELSRLLLRFNREGIETVYAYLEKGRFAEMLGGVYLTSFISEGRHYEVYSYATSSSAGSCSSSRSGQHIQRGTTEQGPETGGGGSGGRSGYGSCSTEEPGNGSSTATDSSAENKDGSSSAGSFEFRSLSKFW